MLEPINSSIRFKNDVGIGQTKDTSASHKPASVGTSTLPFSTGTKFPLETTTSPQVIASNAFAFPSTADFSDESLLLFSFKIVTSTFSNTFLNPASAVGVFVHK